MPRSAPPSSPRPARHARHRPTPGSAGSATTARRGLRLGLAAAVAGVVLGGLLAPGDGVAVSDRTPSAAGSAPVASAGGGSAAGGLRAGGVPVRATGPTPLDPAGFSPGGCVALAPTGGPRRGVTVLLDAGHGGPDPGTSATLPDGTTLLEKDVTLAITRATADDLRARGYRVVLSRTVDALAVRPEPGDLAGGALTLDGQRHELGSRAHCANLAGAAAFVSVHANSFTDPSVGGTETLYEPARPFGEQSRRLATLLHRGMLDALAAAGRPTDDRGVVGGPGAGPHGGRSENRDLIVLAPVDGVNVTEATAMPGALIEPFFLSRPADAVAATSPEGIARWAGAISAGIERYLQEKS